MKSRKHLTTLKMKMYMKESDNPAWWPRKPRWSTFISPSKIAELLLIKCLLEYFAIDPTVHYVDYPDKE